MTRILLTCCATIRFSKKNAALLCHVSVEGRRTFIQKCPFGTLVTLPDALNESFVVFLVFKDEL